MRLGRQRAARAFAALIVAAFASLLVSLAFGVPVGALGGIVAVIPATAAARALLAAPEDVPRIVPAQARTLLAFVVYALGAGIGLVLT